MSALNGENIPSAAQLRDKSDEQVIDLIVAADQTGNSAIAEMHRRSAEKVVAAVDRFNRASSRHDCFMFALTCAILLLGIVQVVTVVRGC